MKKACTAEFSQGFCAERGFVMHVIFAPMTTFNISLLPRLGVPRAR